MGNLYLLNLSISLKPECAELTNSPVWNSELHFMYSVNLVITFLVVNTPIYESEKGVCIQVLKHRFVWSKRDASWLVLFCSFCSMSVIGKSSESRMHTEFLLLSVRLCSFRAESPQAGNKMLIARLTLHIEIFFSLQLNVHFGQFAKTCYNESSYSSKTAN